MTRRIGRTYQVDGNRFLVEPWPGNKRENLGNQRFDCYLLNLTSVLSLCPFCGGAPRLEHTWTASYWVECKDCGAQVHGPTAGDACSPKNHALSAASAVMAWNARV